MPVIAVPKVLREKLGEDGVDSLVELFNKSEEKTKENVITLSEEKFERKLSEETSKFERRLSEEISGVKADIALLEGKLEVRISEVKTDLKTELKDEISKVRVEMSQFKSEIIKWMFLFWIGQIACMAGIVKWLR